MSEVTSDLEKEHNAILLMLDILEKISDNMDQEIDIPDNHLDGLSRFFTIFADKCHHGKEEQLLFPTLKDKGVDMNKEPFASIFEDHKEGKIYISNMLDAIDSYKTTKSGQSKFIQNARKYINLLQQHIEKENQDMFRITNEYLDETELVSLKHKFDDFENNVIGGGIHEQLHEMINELEDYYLN